MDDAHETIPATGGDIETDVKELMGLFDLPAFARRGQELEFMLRRLQDRCRTARRSLLEMVRLRLRQWSSAVTGPAAYSGVFTGSVEPLRTLSDAEPPRWSGAMAPLRRQQSIARDLHAAVLRFNGRWLQFLDCLNLEPTNLVIEEYNRYYLLEKECVMGSARLAARFFTPVAKITKEGLLHDHPTLPVPELAGGPARLSAAEPVYQPGGNVNSFANSSVLEHLRRGSLVCTIVVLVGLSPGAEGTSAAPSFRLDDGSAKVSRSEGLAFVVTYSANLRREPAKARVYVFLGPDQSGLYPRLGPQWFNPQPFFAVNVENWKPGEPLRIDSQADAFPVALDELRAGRYAIQAVVRLNPDTHRIGDGEGNAYGPAVHALLDPKEGGAVALKVDRIVEPRPFESAERIKLVELKSEKLSAFFHRAVKHRAAVILPKEMPKGDEESKLPVLYIIPGFGGDHTRASIFLDAPRMGFGTDFIRVLLDPDCGTGHHVFADSAANGPRGTALVEEFIPHIERTFPAIADPRARLLSGHSSGGWSSLWLQVTYADFFGGTWSTSPDPVDFRDFQRINIYAPGENMFRDRTGSRRPIARLGKVPALFFDNFSRMDDVLGRGGQLSSFEAVFSPLDQEGLPRKLWNRTTGAIDPDVAKAWEAYDIRLILERNWPVLGPKLKGKLHVIMGDLDTFYLEGASKLLKESLARLESDAVVEIVPDRDHATLLDVELAERLDREMKAAVAGVFSAKPPVSR